MSFILNSILKKKVPVWNDLIFNEDAVDHLIQILELPIVEDENAKAKGEYCVDDDGFSFIILKPNLKNPLKVWIILHEIGHHLLHHPVPHKFSKGTKRKMDWQANYFAAIALIPTKLVESKTFGEIEEEYNYPKALINLRKRIYDIHRI